MKINLEAGEYIPSIDVDSATVTIEGAYNGVGFFNADKDEILVVVLRDDGFEFYYYDTLTGHKAKSARLSGLLKYGELRMRGDHSVIVSNPNDSSDKTVTSDDIDGDMTSRRI